MGSKKKQDDDDDGSLVGKRVEKYFKGFGTFSGKIIAFNASRRFYKVVYADGDREELEAHEVRQILVDSEEGVSTSRKRGRQAEKSKASGGGSAGSARREKGVKRQKQEFVAQNDTPTSAHDGEESGRRNRQPATRNDAELSSSLTAGGSEDERGTEGDVQQSSRRKSKRKRRSEIEKSDANAPPTKMKPPNGYHPNRNRATRAAKLQSSDGDDTDTVADDSSEYEIGSSEDESLTSDSSDEESSEVVHVKRRKELDLPALVPLPSSSGGVNLSEELVPDAFATYSLLRSFSRTLFLSPFCLDDFVKALTAETPNSLMDSIHLSLLQSLRRHLQRLAKEGSKDAKNCLRQPDWNLLDVITWPCFLMAFLATCGFGKVYGERITSLGLLDCEYYKVAVKTKLTVLGFLCDEILQTDEIRAELDTRELKCTSQSRHKDRRKSVVKVTDTPGLMQAALAVDGDTLATRTRRSLTGSSVGEMEAIQVQDSQDWNSDECVLCGMNGNLICCDGCPAAFHSRCVGISRASLPPGDWFCPECIMERVGGEHSKRMDGLGGAELLGVDPYGRTFMSTCGYLLVVEPSGGSENKYYNVDDIVDVLQTLDILKPFCNKISKAICKHWNIPITPSSVLNVQGENAKQLDATSVLVSGLVDPDLPLQNALNGIDSVVPPVISESAGQQLDGTSVLVPGLEDPDLPLHCDSNGKDIVVMSDSAAGIQKVEDATASESAVSQATPMDSERVVLEGMPASSTNVLLNKQLISSHALDHHPYVAQRFIDRDTKGRFLTGVSRVYLQPDQFNKSGPYVNYYFLGDASATAAANLALMTAEETSPAENKGFKKKTRATTTAEQLKAFYQCPVRFCWPSVKKKFMEISKERCGWCFCCSNSNLKRGCLINQVATHLAAGAARVAGGIRPSKCGPGHLPAVVGYLLHIEDSVHSLLLGPWQNIHFRKLWRRKVEQAVCVGDVKTALLDLEANIRSVVLLEDWSKCLEDCPSLFLGGSPLTGNEDFIGKGSSRKAGRRAGTSRRGLSKSCSSALGKIQWSRRGKVAHRVSGWAILPNKLARRAARQGGLKRIMGLIYTEGWEIPRRSKRCAWQARTQSACTVEELAVQVRFLDAQLRWDDLASNVQLHPVGNKCEEHGMVATEKPAIHAKLLKEGVTLYLVDSRLSLKQGLQQNRSSTPHSLQDLTTGENQMWVDEQQVPLSLLREFEERDRLLQQSKMPKLPLREKQYANATKPLKKNVFKFLIERAGLFSTAKLFLSLTCKFCNSKVLASIAVQCHVCEGAFHEDCTTAENSQEGSDRKHICRGCVRNGQSHAHSHMLASGSIRQITSDLSKNRQFLSTSDVQRKYSAKLKPTACCELPKSSSSRIFSDAAGSRSHFNMGKQEVALEKRVKLKKISDSQSVQTKLSHQEASEQVPRNTVGTFSQSSLGEREIALNKKMDITPKEVSDGQVMQAQMSIQHDSQLCSGISSFVNRRSDKNPPLEGVNWRSGLESRALGQNKIVLPGQLSGDPSVGPKCSLCRQKYKLELLYIQCEYCPLWFHGDALGITENNISEVMGFKCHKCRKKGGPSCPHDMRYKIKSQSSQKILHQDNGEVMDVQRRKVGCEASSETEGTLYLPLSQKVDDQPLHVASPVACMGVTNGTADFSSSMLLANATQQATVDFQTNGPVLSDGLQAVLSQHVVRAEENDTLQEGYEVAFGGFDMTSGKRISSGEGSEFVWSGEIYPRATLSFTELLSSEDDRVEELAQFVMDFGYDWFETSEPVTFVDVLGQNGTTDLREPEVENSDEGLFIEHYSPLEGGSQDMNAKLNTLEGEEADKITCTMCSDGLVAPDLQCIGCGVAVHQRCFEWSTGGTWMGDGWACDVCKEGSMQGQDIFTDCIQLPDSRILLQS